MAHHHSKQRPLPVRPVMFIAMLVMLISSLSLTIVRMRAALHNVYSRPTVTGNDAAVITACDNIYNEYHAKYAGVERNTVCVVKIYRARMADGIVKESIPLKTYHFGAQPPEPE